MIETNKRFARYKVNCRVRQESLLYVTELLANGNQNPYFIDCALIHIRPIRQS